MKISIKKYEKRLASTYCDKKFKKHQRKRHMKGLTREKNLMDVSIVTKRLHNQNMQRCMKGFIQVKNNMVIPSAKITTSHTAKIHERSHKGEKQYACQFCGKTFAKSGVKHDRKTLRCKALFLFLL